MFFSMVIPKRPNWSEKNHEKTNFSGIAESRDDTSSGYDEVTSDFEDEFQEVGKQGREREGKRKHCRFPFNI